MDKAYMRIDWKNKDVSKSTPINATNLNRMDEALDVIDNRVVELDSIASSADSKSTQVASDLEEYETSNDAALEVLRQAISSIPKFEIKVVETLPTENISPTTVYLVPNSSPSETDMYDEWIYANSKWEHLGSQTIDLSGYMQKTGGTFTGNVTFSECGLIFNDGNTNNANIGEDGSATFTGVTSPNFYGNATSATSSASTNRLAQSDTREENLTPGHYMTKGLGIHSEFKDSRIGLPSSYYDVITIVPWLDSSGGYPIQYASREGKCYRRYGVSLDDWSPWEDLSINHSTTDSLLTNHSVGRNGYTYNDLVNSTTVTFYTNWDDTTNFPSVYGSGMLIPCLDGSMKILTFQNHDGSWVKTIRPAGGTLTEWKSITEGGGGGEEEWTGTKADYESQESTIPVGMKVNITDDYVNPGNGTIYSYDEVVIGTYLGKPLYAKMCDFGVSYAIATTYKVITPSLIPTDMDIVPNASVFMITNDRSVRFVSPVTIYCENGSWKFKSIGEWSASANRHVYMYIEYTKTTD